MIIIFLKDPEVFSMYVIISGVMDNSSFQKDLIW